MHIITTIFLSIVINNMFNNNTSQWRNPRGLIHGLLSVALGQIFIVIPYYYLLRKQYIQRPFIQKNNNNSNKIPFLPMLVIYLIPIQI